MRLPERRRRPRRGGRSGPRGPGPAPPASQGCACAVTGSEPLGGASLLLLPRWSRSGETPPASLSRATPAQGRRGRRDAGGRLRREHVRQRAEGPGVPARGRVQQARELGRGLGRRHELLRRPGGAAPPAPPARRRRDRAAASSVPMRDAGGSRRRPARPRCRRADRWSAAVAVPRHEAVAPPRRGRPSRSRLPAARTAPDAAAAALRASIWFTTAREGASSRRNCTPMPWGFCGAAGSNARTQVTFPSPASATSPPASSTSNWNTSPTGRGSRLARNTPPRVTLGANFSMNVSKAAYRSRTRTGAGEVGSELTCYSPEFSVSAARLASVNARVSNRTPAGCSRSWRRPARRTGTPRSSASTRRVSAMKAGSFRLPR